MPILPREGLTVEALLAPIRLTALQPLITGPLLYFLTQQLKRDSLNLLLTSPLKVLTAILKVLVPLGALRVANNALSKAVLNNWTQDTWREGQEIVVVTGGSSGIGELLVRDLAVRARAVIIFDVNEPKGTQPSNVIYYKVDIRSSSEIENVATAVREKYGDPTVLINNAGVGSPFTLLDVDEKSLHRVLDINLISHFLTLKEFLPAMIKENHGHIVTVASLASFLAIAPTVAYSVSKAGVLAFHEALSNELKVRYDAPKVRTTIVHPCFVRTPLVTRMLENKRFNGFVLEAQTVADAIVKNLYGCQSGQIILPGRIVFWSWIRAFPAWLQYGLRNREGFKIKYIQGH